MTVIEKLRELLKNKNLTQNDFANLMKVTETTINNYLTTRTKLDVETLIKISMLLEVPITYFFEEGTESAKNLSFKQEVKGSGNFNNNNGKIIINEVDVLHKENEILKQQISELKKDKEFLQEMLRKKD